jgi:hypothetical protein
MYKRNAGWIAKIKYFALYKCLVQADSESLRNPGLRLYLDVESSCLPSVGANDQRPGSFADGYRPLASF